MTTIASGINKLLVFKRQTALGTPAVGTTGGQYLRRTTSTLNKKRASYSSKELRPSQQRADMRLGTTSVEGTISGEISVGTYQSFEESVLRALASSAVTFTAATGDITTASTGTSTGTIATAAGNFLTTGFRLGMVIRATNFTTPATANNGTNLFITAITANGKTMTVARLDKGAIVAKTGETGLVGLTEVGKHIAMATSAHTRDYYSIEHLFADLTPDQSELYTDCVVTQMDVKLPGSGLMTNDFMIKGLDMTPATTQYFTAPTGVTTGSALASANGLLYVNGNPVALITGMNVSAKGNYTTIGGVVGSNAEPDIFPGDMTVEGSITVLFTDATMRDYFINEIEVGIYAVFMTGTGPTADFKSYCLPRCKMGGADKDDGEKGLVQTMPFTALENINGGAVNGTFPTSMAIQDSQFV